jgi:hypothetical protein
MTAPRDPDSLIQAFLAEGMTELPDRAFDVVRHRIQGTRQRVVIDPWQGRTMRAISRLAVAAAFVVAIGLSWITFGPSTGPGAIPEPTSTASPSTSPSASPTIQTVGLGELEPGRYQFSYPLTAGAEGRPGPSITITVPSEGWTAFGSFAVDKNYGPSDAEAGASFVVWRIENRYVVPCIESGTPPPALDPSPGPGIDELLQALASQTGLSAGPLTPVTIDGFTGKFVELTVTTDIATCQDGFYPWLDKFVQGNNEVLRVYAIDVQGFRLTFFARIPERTTEADRTELESIIASVDIEPLGQ